MRLHIVRMMGPGKAHHFGGSLSAADLVTALYFYKMRYDPANPQWPDRDRFIMSKGHSVPAQYAALAMLGVLPLEELATLKKLGTRLQGHPAMHYTPGIEGCTGSLGQGLSYANGMALAGRVKGLGYRVYCLLGDGELQEGQVWEAVMTTPKHCLTNLTAIVDRNGLKAMDEPPAASRWSRCPTAGRPLAGPSERSTGTTWRRSARRSTGRPASGRPGGDPRQHRQGQGGLGLRGPGRLPQRGESPRRSTAGPRRAEASLRWREGA